MFDGCVSSAVWNTIVQSEEDLLCTLLLAAIALHSATKIIVLLEVQQSHCLEQMIATGENAVCYTEV